MENKRIVIVVIISVFVIAGIMFLIKYMSVNHDPSYDKSVITNVTYEERDISDYLSFDYDKAEDYFTIDEVDLNYSYNEVKKFSKIKLTMNNTTNNAALMGMYSFELTNSEKNTFSICYSEANLGSSIFVEKPVDIFPDVIGANTNGSGYLYCELLDKEAKYLKITNYKGEEHKGAYKMIGNGHYFDLTVLNNVVVTDDNATELE